MPRKKQLKRLSVAHTVMAADHIRANAERYRRERTGYAGIAREVSELVGRAYTAPSVYRMCRVLGVGDLAGQTGKKPTPDEAVACPDLSDPTAARAE